MKPDSINAYKVLLVSPLLNPQEIGQDINQDGKQTYLARRHSPEQIQYALQVLTNPQMRATHDRALEKKQENSDLFFFASLEEALSFFDISKNEVELQTNAPESVSYMDPQPRRLTATHDIREKIIEEYVLTTRQKSKELVKKNHPSALFGISRIGITCIATNNTNSFIGDYIKLSEGHYPEFTGITTITMNLFRYKIPGKIIPIR